MYPELYQDARSAKHKSCLLATCQDLGLQFVVFVLMLSPVESEVGRPWCAGLPNFPSADRDVIIICLSIT